MAELSTTTRFYFDSLDAAAEALIVVLKDALYSPEFYSFGPLSAPQILESGLILTGDLRVITYKLERLSGAVRHDE